MNKQIKICPICEQGYLYYVNPKYFHEEVIWCDECDATWLKDMEISPGEYRKDFYSYEVFMEEQGITRENIWGGKRFERPYYENEE